MKNIGSKVVCLGFLIYLNLLNITVLKAQAVQDTVSPYFQLDRTVLKNSANAIWFNPAYNNYKPDLTIVKAISDLKKNLRFVIVAGTWCEDTQDMLPKLLKVLDLADIKDKNIQFVGVNEYKVDQKGVKPYDIKDIPTIIIYYNNDEVGRIVETVQQSVEADVYGLISSYLEWISNIKN